MRAYAPFHPVHIIVGVVFSQASLVCAVRYGLNLAVFLLELALHFEIDLSFALDTLLLHVADHALMHCLYRGSVRDSPINSKMFAYGFVGHLLVVDEVNDTNRAQDGTGERCLCFGRHGDFKFFYCTREEQ